jgi:hypothetical protein
MLTMEPQAAWEIALAVLLAGLIVNRAGYLVANRVRSGPAIRA